MREASDDPPPERFDGFALWQWSWSDLFTWGGMLFIAMVTIWCWLLSII